MALSERRRPSCPRARPAAPLPAPPAPAAGPATRRTGGAGAPQPGCSGVRRHAALRLHAQGELLSGRPGRPPRWRGSSAQDVAARQHGGPAAPRGKSQGRPASLRTVQGLAPSRGRRPKLLSRSNAAAARSRASCSLLGRRHRALGLLLPRGGAVLCAHGRAEDRVRHPPRALWCRRGTEVGPRAPAAEQEVASWRSLREAPGAGAAAASSRRAAWPWFGTHTHHPRCPGGVQGSRGGELGGQLGPLLQLAGEGPERAPRGLGQVVRLVQARVEEAAVGVEGGQRGVASRERCCASVPWWAARGWCSGCSACVSTSPAR